MKYEDIRIPGPSQCRRVRELLTADDVHDLGYLVDGLNRSGAKVTGTIEFKGHLLPVAYDSIKNCHYISF